MKKIALVGYGYWGPNLLRNFSKTDGVEVLYCCDVDITRLREARKNFPFIITTTNYGEILEDKELAAVIIATPTKYHFGLAKLALEADKDVLIEKPMTINLKEADILLALARKKKKIIMVDHTFVFNEAVKKVKEIVDSGEAGDILYIDSVRTNLGLFQKDVNVIYDLAPHDFSIIQYVLGKTPKTIQAAGKSHYNKQEDVAYIMAEYNNGITAHVHVSWLSPLKVRTMMIIGTKKMIVYDDVNFSEKIKVYDKGIEIVREAPEKKLQEIRIGYRSGDVVIPNIPNTDTEALSNMANEFVQAITTRREPLTNGEFGRDIVNILDKANRSIVTAKRVYF